MAPRQPTTLYTDQTQQDSTPTHSTSTTTMVPSHQAVMERIHQICGITGFRPLQPNDQDVEVAPCHFVIDQHGVTNAYTGVTTTFSQADADVDAAREDGDGGNDLSSQETTNNNYVSIINNTSIFCNIDMRFVSYCRYREKFHIQIWYTKIPQRQGHPQQQQQQQHQPQSEQRRHHHRKSQGRSRRHQRH